MGVAFTEQWEIQRRSFYFDFIPADEKHGTRNYTPTPVMQNKLW